MPIFCLVCLFLSSCYTGLRYPHYEIEGENDVHSYWRKYRSGIHVGLTFSAAGKDAVPLNLAAFSAKAGSDKEEEPVYVTLTVTFKNHNKDFVSLPFDGPSGLKLSYDGTLYPIALPKAAGKKQKPIVLQPEQSVSWSFDLAVSKEAIAKVFVVADTGDPRYQSVIILVNEETFALYPYRIENISLKD